MHWFYPRLNHEEYNPIIRCRNGRLINLIDFYPGGRPMSLETLINSTTLYMKYHNE